MQPALQLALLLAILLPAAKIAASLCTRFGIPAILGELLVGVGSAPARSIFCTCICFTAARRPALCCFSRKSGGYVLMFIAGVETDIDRMREASVTAFIVALSGVIWPFLLGAGVGARSRSFLDDRVLSGRSADGHQRFDFCPHADGCRAPGFAGRNDHSRRGCHRRRDGPVRSCVSGRVGNHVRTEQSFGARADRQRLAAAATCTGGGAPAGRPNVDDLGLRGGVLRRGIRRGEAMARSVDSSVAQAFRERSGSELRFRSRSCCTRFRRNGWAAWRASRAPTCLVLSSPDRSTRRTWSAAFTPSATGF